MKPALVIGLVGAESTGKTTLARVLVQRLAGQGLQVARVDENLRHFCDQQGRTPTRLEQWGIARAQTAAILAACAESELVIADTTALMTAVYSDHVFGDTTLYPEAERAHQRCGLSLLTALDLPWEPDGMQRDGPHVREPIDALVRASLLRAGGAWSVIAGCGDRRADAALAAVQQAWRLHQADPRHGLPSTPPRWHWHCERCGDTACERHLLLPPVDPPLN
jgi:nicotinamide riboside kinase